MPDAAAAFVPGDRVLLRHLPLYGSLIVDHVRTVFAGEPEPNGPVWCHSDDLPLGYRGRYDRCELVPCPPDYEPPPPATEHWLALRWLIRNRQQLMALHGAATLALAERNIRDRIALKEKISAALAAEPGSTAIRQAEISIDVARERS